MAHDLTIHHVRVADLALLPGNPRQGDIGAVSESMRVNGVYQPIIVNKGTYTGRPFEVIAGNHRAQAAQALDMDTIPSIVLDVDDDAATRIALADNRTSDLATYDTDALVAMLRSLDGLAGTGYDPDDLDELMADLTPPEPESLTDPDDVPSQPAKPISRPGDVFHLGPHRLIIGDGTDPSTLAKLMDGEQAHAYITDPPYNVSYTGGTKDALTIKNDSFGDNAAFEQFLLDLFTTAAPHLDKGGAVYVFHASTFASEFIRAMRGSGLLFKQVLIWVKNSLVLGRQDYQWKHEPILYGWRDGASHKWYGEFDKTTIVGDDGEPDPAKMRKEDLVKIVEGLLADGDVLRYDKPARNGEHPTMKPVELLGRLIANSTLPGQSILDTCAGSGSIMIAAHHAGRNTRMVELDPSYGDVICRRWQEHTGHTPTRDGKPVDFTKDH